MDACIHIPDEWQLHSISDQGLGFLAALRSREGLAQIFNVLKVVREMEQTKACQGGLQPHPSMPPVGPQQQDDFDVKTWEDRVSRVIRLIQNLEGNNIAYTLMKRFSEIGLWSEFYMLLHPSGQSGPDKKRMRLNKDVLSKVASRLGWDKKKVHHHKGMGQKTIVICGGHPGLAAMLPLASDGIFGVTPRDSIRSTKNADARVIGRLMQDSWARKACALGRALELALLPNPTLDGKLEELARLEVDWANMGKERLMGILDEWGVEECDCKL
ncbi:hypothetical protein BGZ61DRAFT_174210 [Ilyonectria robusta]|uniref:uncharacterized protein n=1 Tax=Ilyonectria robusta TaxID=1079257 RepID=UPI001E8DCD18|nr:uncharacterized protein BGZ61DRAFT_174210 [Ilyonectria robusta]KAH8658942.1 hypothetical protein BGZ61DRAFT_174210 [Ilyonectria robusta]